MDDKFKLVEEGYDQLVGAYLNDRGSFETSGWLQKFIDRLPERAKVLDLGCGAGIPVARTLVQHQKQVTGIDISPAQIARAKELVPEGTFEVGNMAALDFPDNSFDGICALYSIIHVPRETHQKLYRDIAKWLKPGGVALLVLGNQDWEGQEAYLDEVEMFWSHYGQEENRAMLQEAGLQVEEEGIVPDPPGSHWFVIASSPSAR